MPIEWGRRPSLSRKLSQNVTESIRDVASHGVEAVIMVAKWWLAWCQELLLANSNGG